MQDLALLGEVLGNRWQSFAIQLTQSGGGANQAEYKLDSIDSFFDDAKELLAIAILDSTGMGSFTDNNLLASMATVNKGFIILKDKKSRDIWQPTALQELVASQNRPYRFLAPDCRKISWTTSKIKYGNAADIAAGDINKEIIIQTLYRLTNP